MNDSDSRYRYGVKWISKHAYCRTFVEFFRLLAKKVRYALFNEFLLEITQIRCERIFVKEFVEYDSTFLLFQDFAETYREEVMYK